MKRRTWWIIGIVLLLLIIVGIVAGGGDNATRVAIEKAAPETIVEVVTASGNIYPETEIKISPEVSGEIIELSVAEGDSVKPDQLLMRINATIYSSMVNQAQASVSQSRAGASNASEAVAQAKSQYDLSVATYNRNKQLYEDKFLSALEFEQAAAQYKTARAAYEGARASESGGQFGVQGAVAGLSQAQENLRKTTLRAPAAGVISQLNVKLGERVVGTAQMAGTELLTIADMSRLEVRVEVSETDIAKVKIGDTALVETDAYRERKFTGLVSKVGVSSKKSAGLQTSSTEGVSNYTVNILILPASYADVAAKLGKGQFVFKPGMSAFVDIQTRRERNVLAVPVQSVTTREWPDSVKKKMRAMPGASREPEKVRQVVFLLDKTKKTVSLREVTTGIQDNEHIQILSGMRAGEEVVAAPYGAVSRDLKDGDKVKIVDREDLFEADKKKD